MTRKLKVWHKLGIIGLAFAIPLALTTYFLVEEQNDKIDFAQAELDGVEYLRPLRDLEVNVWVHADAQRRVLEGETGAAAERDAAQGAVNTAFARLATVDASLGSELQTDAAHLTAANFPRSLPATLRSQWQTASSQSDASDSDREHRELIAGIRGLITHVGNTSKLILDPDLDTYYTMDALLLQEPAIIDLLNDLRRSLLVASPRRTLSLTDRSLLSAQAAELASRIESLSTDLQTAFRETANFNESGTLESSVSPRLQAAIDASGSLGERLAQLARQPQLDRGAVPRIAEAAGVAADTHSTLWTQLLEEERSMLEARKDGDAGDRRTALLSVLAALLLTTALMVFVARRLLRDVNALGVAARGLAAGDLTVRAPVTSDDELGLLARDFNEMAARLDELSRQVRDGAVGINSAATNILGSVSEQTAGAAQQSAAIAEISATTEEIRTTAELMLRRAQEMAEQSRASLEISQDGIDAVEAITNAMTSIAEKVDAIAADILALAEQMQQIGEITALVSDLADQSNLLALNANIEAAKAGEQGKGFAVVAAQVRLLAEQSKQATSQVTNILAEIRDAANAAVITTEAGSKVVEDGMERAGRAGEVIGHLGETIARTAEDSQQIADGAHEQKVAIDQISGALDEVNQATSQFVTGTEVSQNTAQDLNALAGPLRELTERYRVTTAADDDAAGRDGR